MYNNYPSIAEEARLESFYQYPEPIPGIICIGCQCAPTLMPDDREFYIDGNGVRQWCCDDCYGDILAGEAPNQQGG